MLQRLKNSHTRRYQHCVQSYRSEYVVVYIMNCCAQFIVYMIKLIRELLGLNLLNKVRSAMALSSVTHVNLCRGA
jgi:hypothetical protein